MRSLSITLAIACLGACLAAAHPSAEEAGREAPRLAHDHYDPVLLNESAIACVRQGDFGTAAILLERAARLAPHDPRLQRNAQVLRDFRKGSPEPDRASFPVARPVPAPILPARPPAIPAEPPALWPLR